ncbi:helix-turn-helix domain-containing protein [Pleionea sediminis]|uniref:helix-turn-helix domain-containing protein n=1 Tax=Pleionea sediminis TaxID=2569479 RepID=UPI001186E142|nr:helix-turn-helix domain-containing protein [Pleionea sediminis]
MNIERKLRAIDMVKREGRVVSEVAEVLGVSNRRVLRWLQESANQSSFSTEDDNYAFPSQYIFALN